MTVKVHLEQLHLLSTIRTTLSTSRHQMHKRCTKNYEFTLNYCLDVWMEVKATVNCSWKLKSVWRHDFTRVETRGVGIERQGRERDSRGVVFNDENYFLIWWRLWKKCFRNERRFFGMESPTLQRARTFLSRAIKFRSSDLQTMQLHFPQQLEWAQTWNWSN